MRFSTSALAAGFLLFSSTNAQNSSQPCADIAKSIFSSNVTDPTAVKVPAKSALDCMRSAPIDKQAALQFVKSFNASLLQFQSTSAWLKDPPSTYQQPAVDLFARLAKIKQSVDTDQYKNEYDFEADIYNLAQAAHDGHLAVSPGGLGAFSFSGPYPVVSVSRDGREAPQLYSYLDLAANRSGKAVGWSASPLKQINGQDANTFMTQFAANFSLGGLEAHTDWNILMNSPANIITGSSGSFVNLKTYPGSAFDVTFANGTKSSRGFVATLTGGKAAKAFSKVKTGSDYYNAFVRLAAPASSAPSDTSAASTTTASSTLTAWNEIAYPKPFLVQKGLGNTSPAISGFTSSACGTAYMLKDVSVCVLSVPSFSMFGKDAQTFSDFVADYLKQCKKAGMQRVLIDAQANGGGLPSLAADMFKQFFPSLNARSDNQIRSHKTADVLGEAFTKFIASNGHQKADGNKTWARTAALSPWVAKNFVGVASGKTFSSWQDLSSGAIVKSDKFSKTMAWNWSNPDLAAETGVKITGYTGPSTKGIQQPYSTQNIAILTDGICASTCTILVDLFKNVGGARVIVAGGLPKPGVMQGAGGTRGSQTYSLQSLQDDVERALKYGNASQAALEPIIKTGIQVDASASSFNLRNAMWDNSTLPGQFAYEVADCRIYYTPHTFNNYTALWTYAANALWKNNSMCIQGPAMVGPKGSSASIPMNGTAASSKPSTKPSGTSIAKGAANSLAVTWSALLTLPAIALLLW